MQKYVYTFEDLTADLQPLAGGKGASLAGLFQAGFPVPDGFVILPAAFWQDELRPQAWAQVQEKLAALRADRADQPFAVRSSGLSEDSAAASFAGEFETRLNLTDDEQVRAAIEEVARSRHGEKVQAYSQARGLDAAHEVAVVVQKLIPAERSGVLFTANPTNGQRGQALINAAWGLGEAIVSGAVSPDLVVVDQNTRRIVERRIATKQVMTVRTRTGTQERPVQAEKQAQAVLSDAEARLLADFGRRIEALYGRPMDIEWAAAGEDFYILQARPVTALPDPPAPSSWKLPWGAYAVMRVNIIELMAEPLTPLFASLGLEIINTSMNAMLADFLGPNMMPASPIIQVNHYAYYNGSIKPARIPKLLFDSLSIARRMFTRPVERWTEQGRPAYLATVANWQASHWGELSNAAILQACRALFQAAIDAYWSMVGGLIPAAWISEAIFTYVYRLLIKSKADPQAAAFLLGYDSLPIQAEKSLYSLAQWAGAREPLAAYLSNHSAKQLVMDLRSEQPPQGVSEADWTAWQERVAAHLEGYGHMIYNLDFSNPVPADDPVAVLETCKLYLAGEGADPYERQQAAAGRREQAVATVRTRLSGWRLRQFNRWLALAQRFTPMRENALAELGLAYPLLRRMLARIGERLVEAGGLRQPEQIYWLSQGELVAACEKLDEGQPLPDLSIAILERQAALRSAQRATPPMRLPHLALPDLKKLFAGLSRDRQGRSLKGVGASAGRATARACVLRGPEDFDRMKAGEVLVAKLTTPAWTPLFARAAAIVTDVGGPLSHGSIVAREYGIPAVLGTGDATQRIRNGQTVTVDGDTGRVILEAASPADDG